MLGKPHRPLHPSPRQTISDTGEHRLTTDRREFIVRSTGTLGAIGLTPERVGLISSDLPALEARGAAPIAEDEACGARVRRSYALHSRIVNLDHGWTNPGKGVRVRYAP